MAYHHHQGVSVDVQAMGNVSEIRVRAEGGDTFRFFSRDVRKAHNVLSDHAQGLIDEGYTTSGEALQYLADTVFPVA